MKIARQIMNSPDMQDIVAAELRPGTELASDNELLSYARATGVTLYHPVSTCRMGPNPKAGDVVDAHLRQFMGARVYALLMRQLCQRWYQETPTHQPS